MLLTVSTGDNMEALPSNPFLASSSSGKDAMKARGPGITVPKRTAVSVGLTQKKQHKKRKMERGSSSERKDSADAKTISIVPVASEPEFVQVLDNTQQSPSCDAPGMRSTACGVQKLCEDTNISILKIMLSVFFGTMSPSSGDVYKKWCRNITGNARHLQVSNLERVLIKLTTNPGELEISEKYIRIFQENKSHDRDHESELLIYLTDAQIPFFKKISGILQKFCSKQTSTIIRVSTCYKDYGYNHLLTSLLDDIRLTISISFCNYFIQQYRRVPQGGGGGVADGCTVMRSKLLMSVLDSMMRNTIVPMSPCLYKLCIFYLGENLQQTPANDTLGHYNVHPVVAAMEEDMQHELLNRSVQSL